MSLAFYDLRHAYGSTLVVKGAPLIAVANALGYPSPAMVERHYGHLARTFVDAEIRRAAPRLSAKWCDPYE